MFSEASAVLSEVRQVAAASAESPAAKSGSAAAFVEADPAAAGGR